MSKKRFVYVLNYVKTFKVVHKNNPRILSPEQNKKAVLPIWKSLLQSSRKDNCFSFTFVYQKKAFGIKQTIEFCIFELD